MRKVKKQISINKNHVKKQISEKGNMDMWNSSQVISISPRKG
jgi:hypothetical protein